MGLLISNAQTALAYRLGETAAPTNTTELAKRRSYFKNSVNDLVSGDEPYWWQLQKYTDTTVADKPYYARQTGCLEVDQVKINDYEYDKVPYDEVYKRFQQPMTPVPILPSYAKRVYYERGNNIYPIPIPGAAPDSFVTTFTQTAGVATATTASAHGYSIGMYVTIASANQTEYNGSFEILTIPSTTTFTMTVDSGTTSPATGTISCIRRNIEIWGFDDLQTELAAFAETSSILVPDGYIDMIVSFGEARYWSTAHKRGKAGDAFTEYENWMNKMSKENFRRKFKEQ